MIARDALKKGVRRRRNLIECAKMRLATMVHRDGQPVGSVRRDIHAEWRFTADDDRAEVWSALRLYQIRLDSSWDFVGMDKAAN